MKAVYINNNMCIVYTLNYCVEKCASLSLNRKETGGGIGGGLKKGRDRISWSVFPGCKHWFSSVGQKPVSAAPTVQTIPLYIPLEP